MTPNASRSEALKHRTPRREVRLKGYGTFTDGCSFPFEMVNLSYEGCRIEADLALLPAVRLQLSIVGIAGDISAIVQWSGGKMAGLRFDLSDLTRTCETPRRHFRIKVDAQVLLRRQGRRNFSCNMVDITPAGCKVEFIDKLEVGEIIWVKFDGLDAIEARVHWVEDFRAGLEFVRPIYPAVFDLLVLRL